MTRLDDIGGYWTLRAEGYSEDIAESIDSGRSNHWLNIMKEQFEDDRKLKVLDIGTGPGFFPIVLGREGHDITAIDYSPGMLEQAAENCRKYGVEAKLMRMDAQHLEFEDGQFDLVVSRNVVWNLEDPLGAYREWLRVVKDGGKLMIFDGNHYLHLYDREFREAGGGKDAEKHPCIRGVDPTIIRDIAKELPLSRERRPQWDLDNLIELGVQKVLIETDGRDSFRIEKDGNTIYLPFSFFISVTK